MFASTQFDMNPELYGLLGLILGGGGVFGLVRFQTASFMKLITRGLDLQAEHFGGLAKSIDSLAIEVRKSNEQQIRILERLNGS
jgi:hypothetical protein